MKLMIASDLHGSAKWCEKLMEAFCLENPDKLLLLGDILYHGPRNALPEDYNPPRVVEMLNKISDRIICVRGNCDAEVDQMLLKFPILADYTVIYDGENEIFATHGHIYNPDALPPINSKTVLLCGHTHVVADNIVNGVRYVNPGSVSIPKENTGHGYMMLENGSFIRKSLC